MFWDCVWICVLLLGDGLALDCVMEIIVWIVGRALCIAGFNGCFIKKWGEIEGGGGIECEVWSKGGGSGFVLCLAFGAVL